MTHNANRIERGTTIDVRTSFSVRGLRIETDRQNAAIAGVWIPRKHLQQVRDAIDSVLSLEQPSIHKERKRDL